MGKDDRDKVSHVVILGGGLGGIAAAYAIRDELGDRLAARAGNSQASGTGKAKARQLCYRQLQRIGKSSVFLQQCLSSNSPPSPPARYGAA
jgi:hypothetical protein